LNSLPTLHLGSDWNSNRRSRNKGSSYKRGIEEIGTRHHPSIASNVLRGSPLSDLLSKQTASFDIVFAHVLKSSGYPAVTHWKAPSMSKEDEKEGEKMDYGGLYIQTLNVEEGASYRRKIHRDFWGLINDTPPPSVEIDFYYAFDDDRLRNEPLEDQDEAATRQCRRISEHRINFPNCNMFHETQQIENHVKYLR
jgi:hypothetical protein